ncbi:Phospholipase/carboxylesterase/thioesterase domain-containing protein [Strongyloides ratti]|uniref:palmitoyl-protein hydrolase n=1 Tax=Strongyloides ratti TaxID=34506 RepID=A0A090L3R8_STRRB|nr:Phospholipase/carboxylesterase/thioesterase domain-containing protein [Strongyloides ratti]CEF64367.1 Phospholipase/carboxylesterase/thioesterase domain-containing protein [Strongyloides ratti]
MCFSVLSKIFRRQTATQLNNNCRSLSDKSNNMTAKPNPVIIPPEGEHTSTLIFLHGLGDQGYGWADSFQPPMKPKGTKVICPHAAERPVTLNMGMVMPAWFDLKGLSPTDPEDEAGISTATKYVHNLIEQEINSGIPSKQIIVGGFSMGGALAIYAGLTYDKPLGGIIGLSTFLCQRNQYQSKVTANNNVPIFLGHGTADFLLPFAIGKMTAEKLKSSNPNVEFKSYEGMQHSSCQQEMVDVQAFIKKVLP